MYYTITLILVFWFVAENACGRVAQVLQRTRDDEGATVPAPAPKMDEVVCAHNFF